MGVKIGTWNIAFRKRGDDYLFSDTQRQFRIVKNGRFGWAADPFLFDFNNDTYLFVEFFSYKRGRGEIAYAKYDNEKEQFSKYKTIISEPYHMSYPLIFEYKNEIFMLPETNESNSLYMYRAIQFPEKWEKLSPLITDIKLTDTTPIEGKDRFLAFTYRIDGKTEDSGELLLLIEQNGRIIVSDQDVLSNDISMARPAGKCFYDSENLIRVSQDCVNEYGRAINFFKVNPDFEENFSEEFIRKIEPEEICTNCKRKPVGIHTYNTSKKLEVIDLKYYRFSWIRLFYRLLRQIISK